jgi:ketopantoate reductase
MTITVYGAGAIGGITGARLARAGHDVLLVDRADDHVQHTKTKTGIWRDLAVRRRKTEVARCSARRSRRRGRSASPCP